jgi:hypothetical protein
MLAIPLVLGLAATGRPGAAALLLVPAMTLLFMSRYAAVPAAVRWVEGRPVPGGYVPRFSWAALYLGASMACLAAALLSTPPGAFAATLMVGAVTTILGTAQTVLVFAGRGRSIGAELLGMTGLASSAPLLIAAGGRPLDARAAGVGLIPLLYSISSLAFVRAFRRRGKGHGGAFRAALAAHAGLVVLLLVLWRAGWIPAGALLAFVPVFARTVWGMRDPPRTLRALGWREVGVAVVFTGIAAVAVRP